METNADHAEIIETLRQQIEAERATAEEMRRQNDLAEKTLGELQRSRMAEQQRTRLAFDASDKLSGLFSSFQRIFLDIKEIKAKLIDVERRAERLDDILLLLLTEKSPQKIDEAREDLEAEISTRKQLRIHRRNLLQYQEQAAYHGMQVPVELLNKIELEKQKIADLQNGNWIGDEE